MLVLLTNRVSGTVTKFISYHPFSNGQVICNVFFPSSDCITVNGGFNIYLLNGEVKIYVPKWFISINIYIYIIFYENIILI